MAEISWCFCLLVYGPGFLEDERMGFTLSAFNKECKLKLPKVRDNNKCEIVLLVFLLLDFNHHALVPVRILCIAAVYSIHSNPAM